MTVNPDPVQINEWITSSQLLDSIFFIGQAIITQITIAIIMVPLGAQWTTTPVADFDDDKAHLGQGDILIGW